MSIFNRLNNLLGLLESARFKMEVNSVPNLLMLSLNELALI